VPSPGLTSFGCRNGFEMWRHASALEGPFKGDFPLPSALPNTSLRKSSSSDSRCDSQQGSGVAPPQFPFFYALEFFPCSFPPPLVSGLASWHPRFLPSSQVVVVRLFLPNPPYVFPLQRFFQRFSQHLNFLRSTAVCLRPCFPNRLFFQPPLLMFFLHRSGKSPRKWLDGTGFPLFTSFLPTFLSLSLPSPQNNLYVIPVGPVSKVPLTPFSVLSALSLSLS